MSRYIDADRLEARIKASPAFPNMGQDGFFLREVVLRILAGQLTADVGEECCKLLLKVKQLTQENERLHASYTNLERNCASLNDENSRIKADIVQSMRSRIKARCIAGGIYPAFVENVIDQITKEMLEDSRCSG